LNELVLNEIEKIKVSQFKKMVDCISIFYSVSKYSERQNSNIKADTQNLF